MKPAFFIVFTKGENFRFKTRTMARAFATACKLSGHPAIVKPILGE